MSKEIENIPAFPVVGDTRTDNYLQEGMSLRDWYAGMAMQAMVVSGANNTYGCFSQNEAEHCYWIADAMLKERIKTKE